MLSTADSVIISQVVLAFIGVLFLLEMRKIRKALGKFSK